MIQLVLGRLHFTIEGMRWKRVLCLDQDLPMSCDASSGEIFHVRIQWCKHCVCNCGVIDKPGVIVI